MGNINVLPFAVANLIAAGEVVDRPASVIKELLENAIDSGADHITVEIQNGGVSYMRVSDNGCGMSAEDLPVAIRRHATSKIRTAEDLEQILTLGFRGEALAAIASVSHMRIISKTKESEVGCMLDAVGGEVTGIYERAASDGTTVIVEDLFANVPARRKFLKKDVTEATAIGVMVEKIALSKPQIAFRFISDGTVRLETVGDGSLRNAVHAVFGRDFASKLIEVASESEGITVKGFVGRSDNVRANRNYQNFFINGRYVKSKTACAAIEQAYTSYIPPEKFPCCVLEITLHPGTVDVNVHPAKLEVKFSNEKPVFEAIYYAVRSALEENTARPQMGLSSGRSPFGAGKLSDRQIPIADRREESVGRRQLSADLTVAPTVTAQPKEIPAKQGESTFLHLTAEQYAREYVKEHNPSFYGKYQHGGATSLDVKKSEPEKPPLSKQESVLAVTKPMTEAPKAIETTPEAVLPVQTEEPPVRKTLEYRIVGELFNAYTVVEAGDRMLLIDKHAAHERVIFEQLRRGLSQKEMASQLLLLPLEMMMTTDEVALMEEYRAEIEGVGFSFETGKHTVRVSAIPESVSAEAVPDMLGVMVERIRTATGTPMLTRDIVFEKALYQASCKAAMKAGREYPPEYVAWLVDKLMELPDITVCPHGRPVAMELTKKKLDHQFQRE